MIHATRQGQMLSLEQANLLSRAENLTLADLIRKATALGVEEGKSEAYVEGYSEGHAEGFDEGFGKGLDSDNLCSECRALLDD